MFTSFIGIADRGNERGTQEIQEWYVDNNKLTPLSSKAWVDGVPVCMYLCLFTGDVDIGELGGQVSVVITWSSDDDEAALTAALASVSKSELTPSQVSLMPLCNSASYRRVVPRGACHALCYMIRISAVVMSCR
jgi:hypothetical protein